MGHDQNEWDDAEQEAPPHLHLVTPENSYNGPNGCVPKGPLFGTDPAGLPIPGVPLNTPFDPCREFHLVQEELLSASTNDKNVFGCCERCGVRIIIPRVPGCFSFERAGAFVGRAMALDSEEDIGELLAELMILEEQIEKDQRRFKRAQEILEIARIIAVKHAHFTTIEK